MSRTNFKEKVFAMVRRIPCGKVETYGGIAERIGHPGAARAVGNALHENTDGVRTPCHRVVSGQGRLAPMYVFGGTAEQKRRLIAEGVEVNGIRVDLKKYLWKDPSDE